MIGFALVSVAVFQIILMVQLKKAGRLTRSPDAEVPSRPMWLWQ